MKKKFHINRWCADKFLAAEQRRKKKRKRKGAEKEKEKKMSGCYGTIFNTR